MGFVGKLVFQVLRALWGVVLVLGLSGQVSAQGDYLLLRSEACYTTAPVQTRPEAIPGKTFHCAGEEGRAVEGQILWFRVQHAALARSEDWIAMPEFGRAAALHVVAQYADGSAHRVRMISRDIDQHWAAGGFAAFPLPRRAGGIATLFIGYEDFAAQPALVRKINLATQSAFTKRQQGLGWLYGILVGILVAVLCYNLTLYAVLGYRFQLYYCIMSFGFLVYTLSWPGFLLYLLPGLEMAALTRTAFIAAGVGVSTGVFFFLRFVERGLFTRLWVRLAEALAGAAIVTAILSAFAPATLAGVLDLIYNFTLLLLAAVAIGLILWAAIKGSRAVWFFVAASGFLVTGGVMKIASATGFAARQDLNDTGVFIGMAMEALILSIGVADRIRQLRDERNNAMQIQQRLAFEAGTDQLTGLTNRRGLAQRVEGCVGPAPRDVGLLLLDIDHFKQINDTYGHPVGDKVLAKIGETLTEISRTSDVTARVGGEEFLVFVPDAYAEELPHIGERIRRSVRALTFADIPEGISVSVGTAFMAGMRASDYESLYQRADAALYRAKAGGRNRVEASPAEMSQNSAATSNETSPPSAG